MNYEGIDADAESLDERSDYTVARRYMDYELRGKALAEEVEWLHANPALWLRALKAASAEAQAHFENSAAKLRRHPGRWTKSDPELRKAYNIAKKEDAEKQAAKRLFLSHVKSKMAFVFSLLPAEKVYGMDRANIVRRLLAIEVTMQRDPEAARAMLGSYILKIAESADLA